MKKLLALISTVALAFAANVDLNNATLQELASLDGIGEKKARTILQYRKTHCFETIEDLSKVKGIGKKTVAKNKKRLIIGPCRK